MIGTFQRARRAAAKRRLAATPAPTPPQPGGVAPVAAKPAPEPSPPVYRHQQYGGGNRRR